MLVKGRGGYATVLAMLLLTIGLIFSAWLFTAVGNSVAMTHNEQLAARSLAAAESGLEFARHELRAAAQNVIYDPNDTLEEIVQALGAGLQERAGSSEMPGTVLLKEIELSVSNVSFAGAGDTFGFDLTPSQMGRTGLSILSTGRTNGATPITRTVCLEVTPEALWGSSSMDYPLASKKQMSIDGNSKIYQWTDGVLGSVGEPYAISDEGPWLLRFGEGEMTLPPIFPPTELPTAVHDAITTAISKGLLTTVTTEQKNKVLGSVLVPSDSTRVNKPLVFSNCTINGIVYVEWPNSIQFENTIVLNGSIIYGPPGGDVSNTNNDILLARKLEIATNLAAARNNMMVLFMQAGYSDDQAKEIVDLMKGWAIHAPYSDLIFENGGTSGQRILNGNMHVGTLGKSTGMGNGEAEDTIFHGQVLCEGEVILSGNRKFAMEPPGEGDNPEFDRRLDLEIDSKGYWEKI